MDLMILPVIVCGVCGNFHRSSQIAQRCDPEHPYYLNSNPSDCECQYFQDLLLLIAWSHNFYKLDECTLSHLQLQILVVPIISSISFLTPRVSFLMDAHAYKSRRRR